MRLTLVLTICACNSDEMSFISQALRRAVVTSGRFTPFVRGGPPNNKATKKEGSDEPAKKQTKTFSKKKKGSEEQDSSSKQALILEALKPRVIEKVKESPEELSRRGM